MSPEILLSQLAILGASSIALTDGHEVDFDDASRLIVHFSQASSLHLWVSGRWAYVLDAAGRALGRAGIIWPGAHRKRDGFAAKDVPRGADEVSHEPRLRSDR